MKKMNLIFAAVLLVSCSTNADKNETVKSIQQETVDTFSEEDAKDLAEIITENTIDSTSIVEEVVIGDKETSAPSDNSVQPKINEVIEEGLKNIASEIESKTETPPSTTEVTITTEEEVEVPTVDFQEYAAFSTFLKSHVSSSGKVNYSKIKTDIAQLNAIIKTFEENYPTASWTRNEVLVYWINAYNLYTLKLVASNYPVASIKDITAKPWHKKFIKLGGTTISLNDIEHSKIRAKYNEPRIHFALNCASKSCPILLNKAFTTKSLYYLLTAQTKRFLNDATKNDFSNPKSIKISSLFDWYGGDFSKKEGSVIGFINKYRTEQLKNPKISYLEYSWKLNN